MQIPPGFAQVNYRFEGAALPTGAECTLAIDVTESLQTPTDLAIGLVQRWDTDGMDNLYTTEVRLTEVTVKYGPNAFGPTGVAAANVPGLTAAPTCPPNTTALLRKSTAFGGKAGTGRMYIPGMAESFVDGAGNFTGNYVSTRQTAVNTWLAVAADRHHHPASSGDAAPAPAPVGAAPAPQKGSPTRSSSKAERSQAVPCVRACWIVVS